MSDPTRYFHSTQAELQPGDIIRPAAEGYGDRWSENAAGYDPNYVYLFDQRHLQNPDYDPVYPNSLKNTYEVEPLGALDQDPEGEELRKRYEARHGHTFTTLYHPTDATQPVVPGCPECVRDTQDVPEGPEWYHPYNWRTNQARVLGPMDSDYPTHSQSHIASILDPIHSTLDPRVFADPASDAPTLRPELTQWIPQIIFEVLDRHGYDHPENWLTLVLTGSLTTYQYSDGSDCDISLFIDAKKFPDWSRAEMIGMMVSDFDNVDLPGTPHPMQAYVVAPGLQPQDLYKPGLRSGYVVYGDGAGTWIVPPDRDRVHDVEHEMNDAYTVGLLAADKLDLLLRFEPDRAVEYWHELHKRRQGEQTAGNGDYATSNIVFKMLVNRGLAAQAARLAGDSFIPS